MSEQRRGGGGRAGLACLLFAGPAAAAQLQVPGDFATIQAAIEAAGNGDEIVVAPGIYHGSIDFLGKAITVRGTDADGDGTPDTTIHGSGGSVVRFVNGEGRDSVLSMVEVTGGVGQALPETSDDVVGGGILIDEADPTLRWCVIRGNSAEGGGGVFSYLGEPLIDGCVIRGNTASGPGHPFWEGGGGILARRGEVTVLGSLIVENESTLTRGGGIFGSGTDFFISNTVVAMNDADSSAGIALSGTSLVGQHVTVAANTSTGSACFLGAGISAVEFSSLDVRNSIIWDNRCGGHANQIYASASDVDVRYSAVENGHVGEGNIGVSPGDSPSFPTSLDPADPQAWRPAIGSAVVDAALLAYTPPDQHDLDDDGSMFEVTPFHAGSAIERAAGAQDRIRGTGPDMGAVEVQLGDWPDEVLYPGACCLPGGSCVEIPFPDCTGLGGQFWGLNSRCDMANCGEESGPLGACCLAGGGCQIVTQSDCVLLGGDWSSGSDCTDCVSVSFGACCFSDGTCEQVAQDVCIALEGSWFGVGVACGDVACAAPDAIGACCFADGSCSVVAESACEDGGGDWQGDATNCSDAECPQPDDGGVCCLPSGYCFGVSPAVCDNAGGIYLAGDADCADCDAMNAPPCPGDIDGDGHVAFPDLLAALTDWGPCSGCDSDVDGSGDVGFADVLVLLAGWGPCP